MGGYIGDLSPHLYKKRIDQGIRPRPNYLEAERGKYQKKQLKLLEVVGGGLFFINSLLTFKLYHVLLR